MGQAITQSHDQCLSSIYVPSSASIILADYSTREIIQLFLQLSLVLPNNMIVLACIKVDIVEIIFSDAPDHRPSQTKCIASLKVLIVA